MQKQITKPVYVTIARTNRRHCKLQKSPQVRIRLITCRNCNSESLSANDYIYLYQVKSELFRLHPGCNQAIKMCLQRFVNRVCKCLEKNKNLRGQPFIDQSERQIYEEIVRDYHKIYCFRKKVDKVSEVSKEKESA